MGITPPARHEVRELVVLIHGIRTDAVWEDLVAHKFRLITGLDVRPISYGYFDSFRFWVPFLTRDAPLKRIERELRAIRESNPSIPISVIAHSFGTYVIVRILDDNPFLHLNWLILCGSIVPRAFRWDRIRKGQLEHPVINDCGQRDIWPILAQSASWGYGASGTLGFGSADAIDRYHPVTHSEFFTVSFVKKYWIPLFATGEIVYPTQPRWKTIWWQSLLARVPLQWGLIAAILFSAVLAGVRASVGNVSKLHSFPERSSTQIARTLLSPIYFGFDRSTIQTEYQPLLDAKAEILRANPKLRLQLAGNTSMLGSDEYNLALGQRLAAAAKRYLVDRGVDANRFDLVSFGEEHLQSFAADTSGLYRFSWNPNRRSEFTIVSDTAHATQGKSLRDLHGRDEVAHIRVSRSTVRLARGQRTKIYGLAYNAQNAVIVSEPVRYWSEDGNVVTVDSLGTVEAVGVGQTRIETSARGHVDTVAVIVREETLIFDPQTSVPEFVAPVGQCRPVREFEGTSGVATYRLISNSTADSQDCSVLVGGAGTVEGEVRLEWSVDMETEAGSTHSGWRGLAFGANRAGTSYLYVAQKRNKVALFRHIREGDELLVPWVDTDGGSSAVVEVDISEHMVVVRVNGEKALEYPPNSPVSGHIGIVRRGRAEPEGIKFLVFRISA